MPKKVLAQASKVNKDIKNIKTKKQGRADSICSIKSKKVDTVTKKILGLRLPNLIKGGLTVLISFLTIFGIAQAIPPTSPYSPGATLDPSCLPGSVNCTVITPAVSGVNTNITSILGLTTPLGINQGGTGSNNGSIVGIDALTFSAGGTNQNITLTPSGSGFTILNGNIGIGTTTPTRRLAIVDPGVGFDRPAPDNLAVFTADTERMRINATGNIGIGDTTPAAMLTVGNTDLFQVVSTGHVRSIAGTAASPTFSFVGDPDTGMYSGGANILRFTTNAADRLTIDATGNIGIGATTPTSILALGGEVVRTFQMERRITANTVGNALTIRSGGATIGATDRAGGNLLLQSGIATGTGASQIQFWTSPTGGAGTADNALAQRMVIDGAGNIGIGTTAPSERLTVDGNIANLLSSTNLPSRVGAVTLATGEDLGNSIAVSGRYAYVVTQTSPARVVVVDVSNPVSPTRVGAVTLAVGEDWGVSIAVSGRYAYVITSTSPIRVVVVDVSNPASPTRVGAVTLAVGEDTGVSIAVSGRYAYVVTQTSPTRVVVVDVSNPVSPTRVGAVTLAVGEDWGLSIAVSGRYAYVTTNTSPTRVVVVDVSNPVSPTRVGAVTLAVGEDWGVSIAVSGRYAYIATRTFLVRVVVVDIKGMEISSLMAHSLEAGSLQVRQDAKIANRLFVGTGLGVGMGGILSQGPVSILGGSTGAGLSSLDVRNIAGTSLLFVRDDGNIGIGTTAPTRRLAIVDPGVGFDRPALNSLAVFTADTERMRINATGNIGIGDTTPAAMLTVGNTDLFQVVSTGHVRSIAGTAASPTFSFVGDPDTGMYSGGANILRFTTNAADRLTIDATGNIGIGDTTPMAMLTVGTGDLFQVASTGQVRSIAGTSASPTFSFVGDPDTGMYSGGANVLRLATASADRLTIDAVGNIGIGTTAPTRRLAIVDPGVGFDRPALNVLAMFTANVERMRIDSAGNIGIGTTAPTRRLAIVDPGVGFDRPALNVLAMFTADTERMRIDSAGNIGIGTTAPTRRLAIVDPGVGFDRPILNTLAMFTADTERMRIDSAGNIGIGTTLPNSRLHVAGSFATRVDTITATTTLNETHHIILCDATNEVVTINLPVALDVAGRQYITKKIDASANACIVDPAGSETIDGIATHNLTTQWASRGFVSNGTNWFGISTNPQGSIAQYSNDNQSILSNLTDSVKSVLQGLGLVIENGIARIRELSADRIITKEIQMIDRATGCTYYIWIEGGEWKKEIGECGAVPENTPSEPEPEPAPEFISSIPDPIVNPDTNPSNLGTNDDSGEEGEEGYPLAE